MAGRMVRRFGRGSGKTEDRRQKSEEEIRSKKTGKNQLAAGSLSGLPGRKDR